jgi:diguanylate cyclase (GGDEF)-like protein
MELDNPQSSVLETKLRLLNVCSWWLVAVSVAILAFVLSQVGSRERLLLIAVLVFLTVAFYQKLSADRMRRQVAAQMIADLHRRTELLEELSMIDPLTGLYNRRFADMRIPQEFARAERQGGHLTVAMIDLDDFKALNDSFGHAAGDEALQEFASALRRAVRASDLPVRFGGDEFLVVLPDCTLDEASGPVERLQNSRIKIQGTQVSLLFSVGCAQRQPGESLESLLQRADAALYEAKRNRSSAQSR